MKQSILLTAVALVMGLAYTPAKAQPTIPYAHNGSVELLKLAPDATHAITADNRMAILWDTRTGKSKAKYDGYFGGLSSTIDFDPTGTYCFMGSVGTQSLAVYETITAKKIKTLACPNMVAAFFTKDGEAIVTVTKDSIKLIDWKKGSVIRAFAHQTEQPLYSNFQLSADGAAVYMVVSDIIKRIDLADGTYVYYENPNASRENSIIGFASSPAADKLAVSYAYGETFVFDVASQEVLARVNTLYNYWEIEHEPGKKTLELHTLNRSKFYDNTSFFFSADTLVTLVDNEVAAWDLKQKERIRHEYLDRRFDKQVFQAAKDQVWLFDYDSAFLLRLPDLAVIDKVAFPEKPKLNNVVGNYNGCFAFRSGQPFVLVVDDVKERPLLMNLRQPASAVKLAPGVRSVHAYSYYQGNGERVLFTGYDTYVQGWDIETGTLVFKDSMLYDKEPFYPGVSVDVTPSNNFLLVNYEAGDDFLKVFDTKGLVLQDSIPNIEEFDVSQTDKLVYVAYEGEEKGSVLKLLDLKTGKRQQLPIKVENSNFVKISPSGKYVVYIDRDFGMHIYDTKTLKLLAKGEFENWRDGIEKVHFTADEEAFIVVGAEATRVPLYVTKTGKLLRKMAPPRKANDGYPILAYLIFDTAKKGIYTEFSGTAYYFDLQSTTPRKLKTVIEQPFKYEADGSFWVKNTKALTLDRYLPKPGGALTLVEKKPYPKNYSPFYFQGNTWFSTDGTGVTVQTVDAGGQVQQQHTLYSLSASEVIMNGEQEGK